MNDRKILFFPIKLVLYFLVFTEILYLVGPIDFQPVGYFKLYLFLLICNAFLYLGYRKGIAGSHVSRVRISIDLVKVYFVVALLLKCYELVSIWSGNGIPLSFYSVINGILNPGEAYYSESVNFQGSGMLRLIVSPITWGAIPLGIYYWNKVNFRTKCIIVGIILVELCVWIGIGVRKGIFDVLLLTFMLYIARNPNIFNNPTLYKKLITILGVSISAFLIYFLFSNLSRGGNNLNDITDVLFHREAKDYYINNLPAWLVYPLMSIEDYLCQGYDALCRSLEIGIITPHWFTSNWFTLDLYGYFGVNSNFDTYLSLLEAQGIDRYINWHTIYVWLANEYTFIGVPFIVYLIGYCLAETWKDAVYGCTPIVYPILALFLIMTFYSYANNQVLSSSFVPFVFWFIIYKISKFVK